MCVFALPKGIDFLNRGDGTVRALCGNFPGSHF
jgi:hypothetical protein